MIGFFERTCVQEKPGSQEIESRVVLESKSIQIEEKFREKKCIVSAKLCVFEWDTPRK